MLEAVLEALPRADVLLMAAAVADYRPASRASHKIKKGGGTIHLDLARTPDILEKVGMQRLDRQLIVGFAAETENLLENARDKLRRKKLDLIVANDARQAMGSDANQVILVDVSGDALELPLLPKDEVAVRILDSVAALLAKK
jgi:phosphopantothenoylcysteine decarboxylase/phosphopantothenate--cysteine ligase